MVWTPVRLRICVTQSTRQNDKTKKDETERHHRSNCDSAHCHLQQRPLIRVHYQRIHSANTRRSSKCSWTEYRLGARSKRSTKWSTSLWYLVSGSGGRWTWRRSPTQHTFEILPIAIGSGSRDLHRFTAAAAATLSILPLIVTIESVKKNRRKYWKSLLSCTWKLFFLPKVIKKKIKHKKKNVNWAFIAHRREKFIHGKISMLCRVVVCVVGFLSQHSLQPDFCADDDLLRWLWRRFVLKLFITAVVVVFVVFCVYLHFTLFISSWPRFLTLKFFLLFSFLLLTSFFFFFWVKNLFAQKDSKKKVCSSRTRAWPGEQVSVVFHPNPNERYMANPVGYGGSSRENILMLFTLESELLSWNDMMMIFFYSNLPFELTCVRVR